MTAHVRPPDARGVRVCGFVSCDAFCTLQSPTTPLMIERDGRHQLSLPFFRQLPASHVMTARDDARTYAFRHPRADDEVTNLCFNSHEVARSHIDAHGMKGMNPERICVRDFV